MIDYPALQLFIDGKWRSGEGRASEPVLNPSTGAVLGELPHAGAADLDEALASSARGFELWRKMSAVDRGAILQRAATLILERREVIASLITLELGKPIALQMNGNPDQSLAVMRKLAIGQPRERIGLAAYGPALAADSQSEPGPDPRRPAS